MISEKSVMAPWAIAACWMALSLPAKAATTNFEQGVENYKAGRYKQAEGYFTTQVKYNSNDLSSYYYLGLCCQKEKDWARARTIFTYLVTNSPDSEAGKRAILSLNEINLTAPPPTSVTAAASAASSSSKSNSQASTTVQNYASRRGDYSPSADELAALPAQEDVYFTGSSSQILIAAEINRHPITLMFDTGAGDVVIGKNQLSEMGLRLDLNSKADSRTSGSSNDSVVEVWRYPCEVRVGRIVRKMPISILENNQANPLLGQSFFKDFTWKIDYPAHRISFYRKGAQGSASASAGVPFIWDPEEPTKMLVTININGRNCPCWFDTGNTADGISFGKATFQKLGFTIPSDAIKAQTIGITGSGSCSQFRVPYIRLGPIDKTNVLISVHDEEGLAKPLLGQSIYDAYEYSVDNEHKMIYFKRRGHGSD